MFVDMASLIQVAMIILALLLARMAAEPASLMRGGSFLPSSGAAGGFPALSVTNIGDGDGALLASSRSMFG